MEHGSWEREEYLENAKEVVAEFERRINTEVRRQKKLNMTEERCYDTRVWTDFGLGLGLGP